MLSRPTPQRQVEAEGRPGTNQRATGRCWLFAALNVARLPFAKSRNIDDFEFSQAYLFFWDKVSNERLYTPENPKYCTLIIEKYIYVIHLFVAMPCSQMIKRCPLCPDGARQLLPAPASEGLQERRDGGRPPGQLPARRPHP